MAESFGLVHSGFSSGLLGRGLRVHFPMQNRIKNCEVSVISLRVTKFLSTINPCGISQH